MTAPEGRLHTGRLAPHPICNLNSLTGRSSQAVHLRLQKVRLKYKDYPMPRVLHKFCFDSKCERDRATGGDGEGEGKALPFRPTQSIYYNTCDVCSRLPSASSVCLLSVLAPILPGSIQTSPCHHLWVRELLRIRLSHHPMAGWARSSKDVATD